MDTREDDRPVGGIVNGFSAVRVSLIPEKRLPRRRHRCRLIRPGVTLDGSGAGEALEYSGVIPIVGSWTERPA